jgi:hypothetical protein
MNRLSLALAFTFARGGLAVAQSYNPSEGLNMLQLQLQNMVASHGVSANIRELTVAQVVEVIERVNDGADTKQEIEQAIGLARGR